MLLANISPGMRQLLNFVMFQLGWFAVVLGAARDFLWRGIGVALLVMLLHLCMSRHWRRELQLLLLVMVLGTAWDSVVTACNIIRYPSGQYVPYLAPVWIVAMWGLFATTLNVTMLFLRKRYALAALFGAIGAPLSFLAGMRLQALQFPDVPLAMLVLGAGWAVLMPVLIHLSTRLDGVLLTDKVSA